MKTVTAKPGPRPNLGPVVAPTTWRGENWREASLSEFRSRGQPAIEPALIQHLYMCMCMHTGPRTAASCVAAAGEFRETTGVARGKGARSGHSGRPRTVHTPTGFGLRARLPARPGKAVVAPGRFQLMILTKTKLGVQSGLSSTRRSTIDQGVQSGVSAPRTSFTKRAQGYELPHWHARSFYKRTQRSISQKNSVIGLGSLSWPRLPKQTTARLPTSAAEDAHYKRGMLFSCLALSGLFPEFETVKSIAQGQLTSSANKPYA